MIGSVKETPVFLMEYVRALENKKSFARGLEVQTALDALGMGARVQECRWPHIKNIIVDYPPGLKGKRLLFSAHYDAVKGSPAANDNASGVAVLLGLCRQLRLVTPHLPVRIVFFDREEAWIRNPYIRLGLLGSLNYVLRNSLREIRAVYNVEHCGRGDFLAIWSVKKKEQNLPIIKTTAEAASHLKLEWRMAYIPWLLHSSDHLSFRLRGFSNSITLSLIPAGQLPALEKLVSSLSFPKLLMGRRPALPDVLFTVHTVKDTSSKLSEGSLRKMLDLLVEIIRTTE
jgi:hypothetical protein